MRGLHALKVIKDELMYYEIRRYRKLPVEITARRLDTSDEFGAKIVAGWCGGYFSPSAKVVHIPTMEGNMTAQDGDYIIKGVQGEFYPCKPDIFEQTYEQVVSE